MKWRKIAFQNHTIRIVRDSRVKVKEVFSRRQKNAQLHQKMSVLKAKTTKNRKFIQSEHSVFLCALFFCLPIRTQFLNANDFIFISAKHKCCKRIIENSDSSDDETQSNSDSTGQSSESEEDARMKRKRPVVAKKANAEGEDDEES